MKLTHTITLVVLVLVTFGCSQESKKEKIARCIDEEETRIVERLKKDNPCEFTAGEERKKCLAKLQLEMSDVKKECTKRIEIESIEFIKVDVDKVNPENEGKPIMFSGKPKASKLSDPMFGVKAKAMRLKRSTEIYQWVEKKTSTKKDSRGKKQKTVRYSYAKEWVGIPVSTSRFKVKDKHTNKSAAFVEDAEFEGKNANKIGAYTIGQSFHAETTTKSLKLTKFAKRIAKKHPGAKVKGKTIYFGKDPEAPEVGDVRIEFKVHLPKTTTFKGTQEGKTLKQLSL